LHIVQGKATGATPLTRKQLLAKIAHTTAGEDIAEDDDDEDDEEDENDEQ